MGRFWGEVTEHVPSTRLAFIETSSLFGHLVTQARPSYLLKIDGVQAVGHPPRRGRALRAGASLQARRRSDRDAGTGPYIGFLKRSF